MPLGLLLTGFTGANQLTGSGDPVGKYGVCLTDGTQAHVLTVELTLNPDNTFTYVDNSNDDEKINITGTWSLYEGDIYLANYPAGIKIFRIWKAEKNFAAIKSRKGTAYYRLCRIGDVVSR